MKTRSQDCKPFPCHYCQRNIWPEIENDNHEIHLSINEIREILSAYHNLDVTAIAIFVESSFEVCNTHAEDYYKCAEVKEKDSTLSIIREISYSTVGGEKENKLCLGNEIDRRFASQECQEGIITFGKINNKQQQQLSQLRFNI